MISSGEPLIRVKPKDLKAAMQQAVAESVAFQRDLHVKEEDEAEQAIKAEGGEVVTLDAAQREAFAATVRPIAAEARKQLGDALLKLI